MYPFYLEIELIKPVADYFKSLGYRVRQEVRIGFFRADIVAFKEENIIAVELKIKNWKKAVIQAKNYQLGADYVFIAVPLMKSFNILRKAQCNLENEGIGLLVVNEKNCMVSKLINAKKSKRKMVSIRFNPKNKRNKYDRFYS